MPVSIAACFATPVGFSRHPNPEKLNPPLRALFLSREAEGPRQANPQPTMRIGAGLFESRFDLFAWPDAPVVQLREFCLARLYELIGELNGYDSTALGALRPHADAWFHITRNGGAFGLHNHPMASWSGVYCVDPGLPDPAIPASGALSFPHPNGDVAMYVDPANTYMKAPFNFSSRDYRLSAGDLVLFPSWLRHQVMPFVGSGTRITVAFNAWFSLATTATARR